MGKIFGVWFLIMATVIIFTGGGAAWFFWVNRKAKDADKD